VLLATSHDRLRSIGEVTLISPKPPHFALYLLSGDQFSFQSTSFFSNMTNASVNQTVTEVNSEGQAVKVVQVATNAEQIAAAGIGLVTAGPLGAVAAWGTLKAFAGKWTPWALTGFVAAPILGFVQLTGIGIGAAFLEGFSKGYSETLQESSVQMEVPAKENNGFLLVSNSGTFNEGNFNRIQNGMTVSQVQAILGRGQKGMTIKGRYGTMTTYNWGDVFGLYGSVSFRNGSVISSFLMDNR